VGSGLPFSDGRGPATVRASLILKSARASDPRNLIFTKGLSVVRSHEGSGDRGHASWAGGRRVSRACCTEIARRRPSGGNELPGQVLGACQRHGRSFPYLSANPVVTWLKADVGSDLAITGIFPLLTTECKQMCPLPAPALERTHLELPARSHKLTMSYRQEARARTPPPLALYRDHARTGGSSVPEGASLLDASGVAVNATLNQWQGETYFPCLAG
jgi:hypothetical protein